ncbi:DUF4062 domain-containing protein [Myxococcota bacterium]|nr:DUF4062 domain-containing protein [Myxococcota bacterium]MCZ7617600.1 DUF4062 domain-containing protein [Myxococcota bacterium]
MKVFISSVIAGLEPHRDAAAAAARSLGHTVIRAEDFAASPETPQRACLAGVREADAVVLIVSSRYGQPQDSGLSPTHEEYREARERSPVLVMVQDGVERESRQEEFLSELRDWSGGHYTASFSMPEELRDVVTGALHNLELAQATGPVEAGEILDRARALVPHDRSTAEAKLILVVAGGPAQTVLRPSQLEADSLVRELEREALFGDHPVFTTASGTRTRIEGHRLVLEQDHALFVLDEQGSILVATPIERPPEAQTLPVIIEEDLREQLLRTLRFIKVVLGKIDPLHRVTHVVPVAALLGGSYLGWQTRVDHARSPNQVAIPMSAPEGPIHLQPPLRPRAAIRVNAPEIAEDLLVLLRRSRS